MMENNLINIYMSESLYYTPKTNTLSIIYLYQ